MLAAFNLIVSAIKRIFYRCFFLQGLVLHCYAAYISENTVCTQGKHQSCIFKVQCENVEKLSLRAIYFVVMDGLGVIVFSQLTQALYYDLSYFTG